MDVSILGRWIRCSKRESLDVLPPCDIIWWPLTTGTVVLQSRSSRGVVQLSRYWRSKLWVYKYVKIITTMKHVYNESAIFLSYAAHNDINGPSNLTEMASVIDMEGMVPCTRIRHTRDYRYLNLRLWIRWCYFQSESTSWCYDTWTKTHTNQKLRNRANPTRNTS